MIPRNRRREGGIGRGMEIHPGELSVDVVGRFPQFPVWVFGFAVVVLAIVRSISF